MDCSVTCAPGLGPFPRQILRAMGERTSEAQIAVMLDGTDADADGEMDFAEFMRLMRNK